MPAPSSRALLAGALALTLGLPGVAEAQWGRPSADQQAMQLYNQGVEAYNAARWQDAATLFQQAYDLSPRPLLLFNLANAQERMQQYALAAENLRRYQNDAPIEEHADLAARIANLERLARGGGGASDLMIPGVAIAGVGAALLAAGVTFAVLALDAGAGITEGDDPACRQLADERLICRGGEGDRLADYETFALIADIGLFGGGALAAAGLALIVAAVVDGGGGGGGGGDTSWVPQLRIGPGGGWAGIGGAF